MLTDEQKEYARNWRAENQEGIREYHRTHPAKYGAEYQRSWRERKKRRVLTHYGMGKLACVICGETELVCLTIDHVNGKGNQHRLKLGRQGVQFYTWLERESFPLGYQTLCMNCQFKKAYLKT